MQGISYSHFLISVSYSPFPRSWFYHLPFRAAGSVFLIKPVMEISVREILVRPDINLRLRYPDNLVRADQNHQRKFRL